MCKFEAEIQKQTLKIFIKPHYKDCCLEQRKCLLQNVAEKLLCCSSCASFHIPPLPKHTPCDNEKKKKVGRSEKLNHGKDMCCWLILPKTGEEYLKESSRWNCFLPFAFLPWRWVCFILILTSVLSLAVVAGRCCSLGYCAICVRTVFLAELCV